MITRDLECPWHDNCIICSYDVMVADFENSHYAFDQSEKELESSMYNNQDYRQQPDRLVKNLSAAEIKLNVFFKA